MMSLKSGDRLEVVRPFITLANVIYGKGDILELIEPTGQDPFGHGNYFNNPHNWVVKCKAFSPPSPCSVWGGIYQLVELGMIRKV